MNEFNTNFLFINFNVNFFIPTLGTVFQDQVVFQVCVSELGYNVSDCLVLGTENNSDTAKALETAVQPYVTDLLMAKAGVETVIPAFLSLFIGPWSDKFGRKPIIVASLTGFAITYLVIFILSWVSHSAVIINPWYYVIASSAITVTGGTCILITGVFCYIADVTTEKDRATRMGVIEAALFAGLVSGSFSSSFFYNWFGSVFVFGLATGSMILALLYVIFFVEESRSVSELEQRGNKLRELFRFELVKDMMAVCFKRRANHDRAVLWIIMISLGFCIFVLEGNSTVFFLFVRERFDWSVRDYTIYSAIATCSLIVGNLVAMYWLKRVFGFSEVTFAIIAFAQSVLDSFIAAIAFRSWHLYLGIGLTMLKGLVSPMCRSILATTSERSSSQGDEIGKIYAMTTALESLLPIAAVPAYTLLYKSTISTFPGAFNFISAGIYGVITIMFVFIYVLQNMYRVPTYSNVINS